jgi:hypothetical protein
MFRNADCEKTQAPPPDDYRLNQMKDAERADRCTGQGYQMAGCDARPLMTAAQIVAEFFKYQPPNDFTIPKFAAINQAAKNFAEVILANCPAGHDRTGAINCIRTARMVANAAIALNGLSL